MGFQPGNKLSPGRPKGSSKKKAVKQIADSMALDNFDIYAQLVKLLATCTDDAVRLRTLQFMAQYSQGAYKHEPDEQDTQEQSNDRSTADLVSLVKS